MGISTDFDQVVFKVFQAALGVASLCDCPGMSGKYTGRDGSHRHALIDS